jgi:hypothetical protein
MLQRILGGHPDIHTVAEPWIMLHPCFGLKGEGYAGDYEAGGWARLASGKFIDEIGGRSVHVEAVREMGKTVYDAALSGSGKRFFLDKTPRYYYIISELAEVFPKARFIILLRNPLAVLCSIIRSWVEGHWSRLSSYRDDLLLAPGLLVDGTGLLGERVTVVRYEELVTCPEEEVSRICRNLDVAFDADLLNYGRRLRKPLAFGDSAPVQEDSRPDAGQSQAWTDDLANPRTWQLAGDYLACLGQETLGKMGYDSGELAATLSERRPGALARLFAPSLMKLLNV